MKSKIEQLLIKFGRVGIIIYLTLFFLTFLGMWCVISFGINIKSWSFFSRLKVLETVGIWGLAYAATKITQPLRILITVALASLFVTGSSKKTEEQVKSDFTSAEEKGENDE